MKGMVVSNEPGYYEDGSFGIRIENLLIVNEVNTPHRFGGVSYFGFERLTFCPLQRKMLSMEASSSKRVDIKPPEVPHLRHVQIISPTNISPSVTDLVSRESFKYEV